MNPKTILQVLITRLTVIAFLSVSVFAPSVASAANKYWIGGSDWWDVGTNWNPPGQPQNGDYVYLTQSDGTNRTIYYANTLYPSALLTQVYIDATGTGIITLDQAKDSLASQFEYVGHFGIGSHTQSGGTNTVYGSLYVGNTSTSSGSYNLSGTGNLTVGVYGGGEYIGLFGTGTFTQSGGTHTVNGPLSIGTHANGTYNQSGGALTTGSLSVGVYAGSNGAYTQTGGGVAAGSIFIGGNGANGSYSLSGTANLTASYEIVGQAGTGVFNQTGGTNTVSNTLYIGYYSYSSGAYNLSAGSLSVNDEYIGYSYPAYYGTGSFIQTGGTHTVNNNLYLGYDGTGTYTLDGGAHNVEGDINLSYIGGSSGTYNLNAGAFTVGGNVTRGIGSSTLNVSGGTFTVGGGNGIINVGNLVLGATAGSNINYTLSGTGLYENANKVAGALTTNNLILGRDGTGTFSQTGGTNTISGTVTLAANAGSAGTYNLNDGLLNANTITINNGGTFNFNGGTLAVNQFNGDLTNLGGTLAPGNSPGTTNVTGNYSQSNAGTFAVEIGGTGIGQFDVLNISGTATLDGTLNVSLFDYGSGLFAPQAGDFFDILTAQILSGQFSTLNLAALDNGLDWNINYLTDAIDTTDIVRLSVVSTVPLPPALWLFGSGLLGLIGIARKRKFH